MRFRRLVPVAVAAATLVSPLAAFAASVTTDPIGQAAPALTTPMLGVLAIVLIGLGIYRIRTHATGTLTGLALLIGLSLLAGVSYATIGVVVKDAQCTMRTTQTYSDGGSTLTSLCPNPIEIVAIVCKTPIEPDVVGDIPTLPTCTVGEILATNDACRLLGCDV